MQLFSRFIFRELVEARGCNLFKMHNLDGGTNAKNRRAGVVFVWVDAIRGYVSLLSSLSCYVRITSAIQS